MYDYFFTLDILLQFTIQLANDFDTIFNNNNNYVVAPSVFSIVNISRYIKWITKRLLIQDNNFLATIRYVVGVLVSYKIQLVYIESHYVVPQIVQITRALTVRSNYGRKEF